VFGGYSSLPWTSIQGASGLHSYKEDKEAFLFSLTKGLKLRQARDFGKAVNHYFEYMPTYGSGHDLRISDKCNENSTSYSNLGSTYQLPPDI